MPKESSLSFEFASNSKTDKLDNMRKRISDHMRYSLNTSAHVHIMNEVDMTDIVDFVKREDASFRSKEGFNLTITPFIISSLAKVLNEMPELNSSIDGDLVMFPNSVIIGNVQIKGLVVVSNGCYIKDEGLIKNKLVFGKSPNIIFKDIKKEDIQKYLFY